MPTGWLLTNMRSLLTLNWKELSKDGFLGGLEVGLEAKKNPGSYGSEDGTDLSESPSICLM